MGKSIARHSDTQSEEVLGQGQRCCPVVDCHVASIVGHGNVMGFFFSYLLANFMIVKVIWISGLRFELCNRA